MKECNYKRSSMTPCVVTDGDMCYAMDSRDNPICVGCSRTPAQTGVPAPDNWKEVVSEYKRRYRL